jgi:hypothetical protein
MDRLQNELDHGLTENAEGAALAGRALIWHNSGQTSPTARATSARVVPSVKSGPAPLPDASALCG